jgi:hypothetical protein
MSFEEYLMAPHYDRHADPSAAQNDAHIAAAGGIDEAAMDVAAEALREVEVEAAQPEPEIPDVSSLDAIELESMNIDELRLVAKELDIPDRATITEKEELLAAIRQRFASST